MPEPIEGRADVCSVRRLSLSRVWHAIVRQLMCVALSPRLIRWRILARGEPLLGLPALPNRVLESAGRIIVLRLDRLGDAILFSSFLRELRLGAPKAEIHLVCSPAGFPAYEHCPHVDRIHTFDHGPPVFTALSRGTAAEHWRLYRTAKTFAVEHLAPLHADLLLAPRFEVDGYGAVYLGAFSRARISVSYSEMVTKIRHRLNRGHDNLWSLVIPALGIEHEVVRNASFLAHMGLPARQTALEYWPTAEERNAADAFLARHAVSDRPVVLAPGASEPRKQWPLDRFAAVADLVQASGMDVLLVGSESDAAACASIMLRVQSPRVKDICGQLSLGSLFCVMQRSSGFIGNDSGPAHLAAAAGVPVIVVSCHPIGGEDDFHQNPRRFGPWGVPQRVLQPRASLAPCVGYCSSHRAHCIEQVSVDQVVTAARGLLIDGNGVQDKS